MNFKKYISFLLVLFVTASVILSGCGSANDIDSSSPADGAGRLNTGTVETEAAAPEPLPKNGITICVDPGHGFDDPGASNVEFIGDLYEKDITVAVSKCLKKHLEDLGFTVVMTHDGETFPITEMDDGNNKFRVEERVSYANSLGSTIDYYISLHCDKYDQSSEVRGTRIFYGDNVDTKVQPHLEIAETIANKLAEDFPEAKTPVVNEENFYVIKYTKVPSCLVEMGFISNSDDAADLTDPDWQDKFAKSLADGLYNYYFPSSN